MVCVKRISKKSLGLLAILAIVASVTTASVWWFFRIDEAELVAYDQARDLPFIQGFFDRNLYWMIADPGPYSLDPVFKQGVSSARAELAQPVHIAVLRKKNQTIGFIVFHKTAKAFEGKILFVGVDEMMRGHGYAAQLVKYALARFRTQGYKTVYLITRTQNTSSQSAYKKMGFAETARDDGFVYFTYTL